jgi:hypothetical protein
MKKLLPFLLVAFFFSLAGEDVRPVRDDVGFCWQRPQMKRLMDLLAYSEGVLPLKNAGFGITAPYSRKHWVGFVSAGFYLD